jgi:hypothetical protein
VDLVQPTDTTPPFRELDILRNNLKARISHLN